MKIGQHPDIASALSQSGSAKQQAKAASPVAQATAQATANATAGNAGVPVTFSNAARGLDSASRNLSDFDAGKVKAVRAAIDNGTFSVDAEAIADKLLANAQEVVSRSRG
jgi:negative regulator of flagellin synthesis FlgM